MEKMDRSITPILFDINSPQALWFFHQVNKRSAWAHHPTCACFDNHLLYFGPFVLCLGCTCMACGIVTCLVILGWLSAWRWDFLEKIGAWRMVGLGLFLWMPTLIQPFFQKKPFKIISRFFLGVSIPCLWFGALFLLPWNALGVFLRTVFVVIFWETYRFTQRFRSRRTANPCDNCPRGAYPFCQGNHLQILALANELRKRACPEDQPLVMFALALAGQTQPGISVEIIGGQELQKYKGKSERPKPFAL